MKTQCRQSVIIGLEISTNTKRLIQFTLYVKYQKNENDKKIKK